MPSFAEIFAQKMRELDAAHKAAKDASGAQIPKELQEDYAALKTMAQSKALPKSMQEAAGALASAAQIARAQGVKASAIPGTDLQWPPSEAFNGPMGYAPYLPKFQQVLAMTFPAPKADKPRATKAVTETPKVAGDPLAEMKSMVKEAGPLVASAEELPSVENLNGN